MRMSSATIPRHSSSSSINLSTSRRRYQSRHTPTVVDDYAPLELPLRWRDPQPEYPLLEHLFRWGDPPPFQHLSSPNSSRPRKMQQVADHSQRNELKPFQQIYTVADDNSVAAGASSLSTPPATPSTPQNPTAIAESTGTEKLLEVVKVPNVAPSTKPSSPPQAASETFSSRKKPTHVADCSIEQVFRMPELPNPHVDIPIPGIQPDPAATTPPLPPAHTELPPPLSFCSRDLSLGVEPDLSQPDSSVVASSSRERQSDLPVLHETGSNPLAALYAPATDGFHHPTLLSLPDPAASDDVNMDDGFAPQTPIQSFNPIFNDRTPASAQISQSNPPACLKTSVAACSDSDDTESTSDQIHPHVVARSVPLLCGPMEPVGTRSILDQDPLLKYISNLDNSEIDKLFCEISNATSCKSMVGGVHPSGDERCGYIVYSCPACRYRSDITGGIDECGYGYVPSIGRFEDASSSPVLRWITRTLLPTIDDFIYPVSTLELSSGLAESTASSGIAASLVGKYGDLHCPFMGSYKQRIWEAIRACSADPNYFDDLSDYLNQWQYGAILTNNPTIFTIREAQLLWPDARIDCLAFESLFERLLSRNANEDKLAEKLKSIYADTMLDDDSPSLGWRRIVLLIESSYNLVFGKSVNHARALETFCACNDIKLSHTNSPVVGPQRMSRIDLVPLLNLDGHPLRKATSPTSPLSLQPSINILSLNKKLQSLPHVVIIQFALQNDSTGLILSWQNDVFVVPEPGELADKFVFSSYFSKLELGFQKIRSLLQLGEAREQDQKFFHNVRTFLQKGRQEISMEVNMDGIRIILRMPIQLDALVWGALLGTYKMHENVEFGERIDCYVFKGILKLIAKSHNISLTFKIFDPGG
ncbi:hypothetical protein MA16_Dca017819 [Dendrobium catenatum]|uniref:Uncharacterized protein n=1 Tax=Dendrobium catenatum TaxID=906689 RepID=A0A2I0XG86_9ASPA|nr:hypothetical protein MA16_Dca017819 [Dendrobium catenatum]